MGRGDQWFKPKYELGREAFVPSLPRLSNPATWLIAWIWLTFSHSFKISNSRLWERPKFMIPKSLQWRLTDNVSGRDYWHCRWVLQKVISFHTLLWSFSFCRNNQVQFFFCGDGHSTLCTKWWHYLLFPFCQKNRLLRNNIIGHDRDRYEVTCYSSRVLFNWLRSLGSWSNVWYITWALLSCRDRRRHF